MGQRFDILSGAPGAWWRVDEVERQPDMNDEAYHEAAKDVLCARQRELRDIGMSGTVTIVPVEVSSEEPVLQPFMTPRSTETMVPLE